MSVLIVLYVAAVLVAGLWASVESAIAHEKHAFMVHQVDHAAANADRFFKLREVVRVNVTYDEGQRLRRVTGLVLARFGVLKPFVRWYVVRRLKSW